MPAQCQESPTPQLHMLNRIGRPVLFNASLIAVYLNSTKLVDSSGKVSIRLACQAGQRGKGSAPLAAVVCQVNPGGQKLQRNCCLFIGVALHAALV